MTTQKPTSRALIKRERDEDSHESSFADLSETNLKRVPKGAARGHNREPLAKKRKDHESDDSSEDDEDDDSDLSGFIAKDEEVEQELIEEMERKKKKRRKAHEREREPEELDEEDLEVIKENFGIDVANKKKNRLKRNADLEAEKQAETRSIVKDEKVEFEPQTEQIDTSSRPAIAKQQSTTSRVKEQRMEIEKQEFAGQPRVNINQDQIRQAQEIFGDDNDGSFHALRLAEARMSSNVAIEEIFHGDEIDDPFSSAADQKILRTDIPERLQVKLENRLKSSDEELTLEADWVLERLSNYIVYQKDEKVAGIEDPFDKRGAEPAKLKYGKLLQQKDAKEKISRVLHLLRSEMRDVPMIAKHRKMQYADELDEDSIWIIYNLDQEYGKFLRHKRQIQDFLNKVILINPQIKVIDEQLLYAKTQSDLNNFNALIRFLRSYYQEELAKDEDGAKKKAPPKRDEIREFRKRQFDEFASYCFISWSQFLENLRLKKLAHVPPELKQHPSTLARQYSEPIPDSLADDANEVHRREMEVFQGVCKLAAIELSVQPFIRNLMKKHVYANYELSTHPTDQGQKDLDLFHQSYRVKRIQGFDLRKLKAQSDLFLDVEQCEKTGLIKVEIQIDKNKKEDFKDQLSSFYMQKLEGNREWNIMRSEVIRILYEDILQKEIVKEIRDEIREDAENFVIARCKESYRELCYTGPFTTTDPNMRDEHRDQEPGARKAARKNDSDVIKDRDRLNVMGALMHQIDQNNYLVTVAVVNKYGDVVQHQDFKRLLPPKIRRQQPGPDGQPLMDPRLLPKSDDEVQHEKEKEHVIKMLEQFSVDLIVVAANSLKAIELKRSLEDVAAELKNREAPIDDDDPKGKNYSQRKEAFVIWGSTEVPKLFSLSHNSQRILVKNTQQMLKQAISLARFEQDPLAEILNLWSPINAENQALQLNLDPMQKLVNQSKLADGLEEVNIQVVNDVGIDINMIVDHEHLHSMLPFLSGLGPRKAKDLISKIKGLGRKIWTRAEIFKQNLLGGQCCYVSAIPFIKVKIPEDDITAGFKQSLDLRDQTRIHIEYYDLALKIACDACQVDGETQETDQATKLRMLKEVIMNPSKLSRLDMKGYYKQLELTGRSNYKYVVEQMIKEFTEPFKDPRPFRSPTSINIKNERLLYLLIDESKRTFKTGIIVTATVNKVLDSKAICRLDNGLTAIIPATKILEQDSQEKLKDIIDIGHIVTGRIIQIKSDDEKSFEVTLNCKQTALSSHEEFKNILAQSLNVNPEAIPHSDLQNQNFSTDLKPKQTGRFVMRRIAHEKFKNISSRRALAELQDSEVGDYVFRPSTRSENSITLTWKFFKKHFVHIDIIEQEKPQGAAIGKRLLISNDSFENLREIIERYIIPCNRLVREVTSHTKFLDAESFEELEERVKEEKKEQPSRIPYRFSILPMYPQHVVLAYVPREKVVKEFIKVRPKGFYFHDLSHAPFQTLINWFKDNWSTRDYQRLAKRQKSPKTQVKPVTDARQEFQSAANRDWKNGGDFPMKSEMKPEYGLRPPPTQVGSMRPSIKDEAGSRSPNAWNQPGGWGEQQDVKMQEDTQKPAWGGDKGWGEARSGAGSPKQNRGRGQGCFKCGEDGHFSRECPKAGERSNNRGCFKCGEEGHMARECPNPQAQGDRGGRGRGRGGGDRPGGSRACYKCQKEGHMARDCPEAGGDDRNRDNNRDRDQGGAYKRPRRDDDGGYQATTSEKNAWGNSNQQENGWGASGDAKW